MARPFGLPPVFSSLLSALSVVALLGSCASTKEAEKTDAPARAAKTAAAKTAAALKKAAPEITKTPTYQAHCATLQTQANALLAKLEAHKGPATIESVLLPLNELQRLLDDGYNGAELMSVVHPDAAVRKAAEGCAQAFNKIDTAIGLSRPLYEGVQAVDVSKADANTQRYVAHMLRDFRRAGVDKNEATRQKIKKLNEELVEIGQAFGRNIRENVRSIKVDSVADLEGMPQDYIDAHKPGDDGKITITTNYPDYIPFMTYAKSDALRLAIYKEFRKRGYPKNIDVLQAMIQKRWDLAHLLGYKSWADYITEDKMIGSEKAAEDFINKINVAAQKRANSDYKELLSQLRKEMPKATSVGDWQKTRVEEQLKKSQYAFDSQVVRQYITYDKVKKGLFDVTSKMYDITYKPVKDASVWDASVDAYDIIDHGKAIGRFFLDMHPRDNKYKHAAMFPIISGLTGKQLPRAALVCNFPATGPMEFGQAKTFFHEFGHLLHHIFAGQHKWVTQSGINTEWDFVEAPSQMFEDWVMEPSILKAFATNDNGEPIPDSLIAALKKADGFGRGLWVRHQMFYAAVSLNYYNRDPSKLDTTELMKKLQATYSPYAYVDDTFFQTSFGHLDGYSAIYYTYMWSLVIAKDMFSRFEKEGLVNPKVAKRYRDMVLAPGGTHDAADLVNAFLERPYTFDSFADWLNDR